MSNPIAGAGASASLSSPASVRCKYCFGLAAMGSDRCNDCTAVVADMAERGQDISPNSVSSESSRRRLSRAEAVSGLALSQARRVAAASASDTVTATTAAAAAVHAHTRVH